MIGKKNLFIIFLLLCVIVTMQVDTYSDNVFFILSESDMQSLKAGNILIKKQKQKTDNGEIARVMGAIIIHKPAEEVWTFLMDWEKMPTYVEGLDYYKVIARLPNNISIIEGQIHVTFLKIRYTLIVSNNKNKYYQQWQLISQKDIIEHNLQNVIKPHSNGIKKIEGYQYCVPFGNNATIIYYAPIVEVSVPVPGFIENSLTQKSIKDYLYGIKNYLEKE